MKFPLSLSFKIMALAPQIRVLDADGQLRLYVRQKAFKLKEAVNVFADEAQTQLLYTIQADKVFDFNATYRFRDAAGTELGALRSAGMRTIWKAHFDILRGDQVLFTIREQNPWTKVADAFLGDIPIIGLLSNYLFHPAYQVRRAGDDVMVLRIVKQPAMFEGKFNVELHVPELPGHEEGLAVLSLLMMTLLMRARG